MSYNLTYRIIFNNRQTEEVIVGLYKKDVLPDEIINLKGTQFSTNYLNGDGDKFDTIIACEAIIGFFITITDTPSFTDFITSFHDEWKVIATVDAQEVFVGFLNPSEGRCEFRDKPYELVLSAIDGIAFLKTTPFTDFDGNNFTAFLTPMEAFAGIFAKTLVQIPIRTICNIYNTDIIDRDDTSTADMLSQVRQYHRTFLNKGSEYISCYEALERLCKEGFSVYQWNGKWVVLRCGEMQDSPGPNVWYTDYDHEGTATGAAQMSEFYGVVGSNRRLHPVHANQSIASNFAIKSARHEFKYVVPPDIVNNEGLALLGNLITETSTYRTYELVGWTHYKGAPIAQSASAVQAFIKTEINPQGVETDRYVVVPVDTSAPETQLENYVRNNNADAWVDQGDKLDITVTARTDIDRSGTTFFLASLILLRDGFAGTSTGHYYSLDDSGSWTNSQDSVFAQYDASGAADTSQWVTFALSGLTIPADGKLFVLLGVGDIETAGAQAWFKDLKITYYPHVRGSQLSGIGDYWLTEQNTNYFDKVNEEIFTSDSLKRNIRGAWWHPFDEELIPFNSWYRFGFTEQRHYKELINLARFNAAYRRTWKVEGTFGGTKYNPYNNSTLIEPISFHKHFTFPDSSDLNGYYFQLVPPLKIDYLQGEFDGVFCDCFNDAVEGGDYAVSAVAALAALINQTTEAEWDDAFGAPGTGTDGFPPQAGVYLFQDRTLIIIMDSANGIIYGVNDGGVGNSPTITETSNDTGGGFRIATYQIGTDVLPGNVFTITIYGHSVSYTVQDRYSDGNQIGNTHKFDYIFSE